MNAEIDQSKNPYAKEREKPSWGNPVIYIVTILFALFSLRYMHAAEKALTLPSLAACVLDWAITILFVLLGFIIRAIGKLVMGLISGYKILIFSAGPLSLVRENGKLVRKKLPSLSALGQCMMAPKPAEAPEEVKYFWYLFGGIFFDLIAFAVSVCVMLLSEAPIVQWIASCAALAMLVMALIFAIPANKGAPNDGMLLKRLIADPQARLVNNNISAMAGLEFDGVSPADMPQKYFAGADASGALPFCNMAYVEASYMYACGNYSDAAKQFELLLQNETIQKSRALFGEVRSELAYCRIILGEGEQRIDELLDEATMKHLNAWGINNITKLRILYAYYLLSKHDAAHAEEIYSRAVALRESCICLPEYEREFDIINKIKNGQLTPRSVPI